MKHLRLVLLLLAGAFYAKAQFVEIPDANFRDRLLVLYPSCFNNQYLLDTLCAAEITGTLDLGHYVRGPYEYRYNIASIEGIHYFKKITILDCSGNLLKQLPKLPQSLTNIDCSLNQLTSLPSDLPPSLTNLDCSQNQLSSLPFDLPTGLLHLNCSNNQIGILPSFALFPLLSLRCTSNEINELPALPNTLTLLYCGENPIKYLPDPLPSSLKSVSVGPFIESFPDFPSTLETLGFNGCPNITQLPSLPESLTVLHCFSTHLTSLPTLPSQLRDLQCTYGKLTSLPSLPASLYSLDCRNNQLTSLPYPLPVGLNWLTCEFNQISVLEDFPPQIYSFSALHNLISKVPAVFPNSLKHLRLEHNLLTSFVLPDSASMVLLDSNYIHTLTYGPNYNLSGISAKANCFSTLPIAPSPNIWWTVTPLRTDCDMVTGLDPYVVDDTSLLIYPVPAQDHITWEQHTQSGYAVYNSNAAKVLQGSVQMGQARVDISSLPNGIYYVKTNDQPTARKISVLR